MAVKLRDTKPGDTVVIKGVVMDRQGTGNVRVLIPGVGEGGTWAIAASAEVEVIGNVKESL